MVYPPPTLPTNRTNADPQMDTHPADHNALALAINDLTARAAVAWDPVGSALYRNPTAAQVIAKGVWTAIGWSAADDVPNVGGAVPSSSLGITVPNDGIYLITGRLNWDVPGTGTGSRQVRYSVNTAAPSAWKNPAYSIGDVAGGIVTAFSLTERLVAQDVVNLQAYQSSSANVSVLGAFLSVYKIAN